jgi:hypothetical protein
MRHIREVRNAESLSAPPEIRFRYQNAGSQRIAPPTEAATMLTHSSRSALANPWTSWASPSPSFTASLPNYQRRIEPQEKRATVISWRSGRAVEGTGFENRRGRTSTVGSNPSSSAKDRVTNRRFVNEHHDQLQDDLATERRELEA